MKLRRMQILLRVGAIGKCKKMGKKKILFFIHRYPAYGGIETVTTVLANYLFENGYEVGIISQIQEDENLLEKLNGRIRFFRLPNKRNMYSEDNTNFLYSIIAEFKPDVLINQESYSGLFYLLVKIKSKISCKIITVEHNTPDARYVLTTNYIKTEKLEFKVRSLLKKIALPYLFCRYFYEEIKYHRLLYKYSDEYILLSEKFIPIFKRISYLKDISKIKTIENPITINLREIDVRIKEKIVLYVGRLDYGHKRVDRLVKIWESVSQDVSGWKLMIIGDGPDKKQLESYISEHCIPNIFFEGMQSNVEKYYAQASILCLTSSVEGWPLVLAEAMAFGCVPVLYNSFASASDIVDDGMNGLLISPFDENLYKNALLELIRNKRVREEMANKAIEDCDRFSLSNVGNKWQKILN